MAPPATPPASAASAGLRVTTDPEVVSRFFDRAAACRGGDGAHQLHTGHGGAGKPVRVTSSRHLN